MPLGDRTIEYALNKQQTNIPCRHSGLYNAVADAVLVTLHNRYVSMADIGSQNYHFLLSSFFMADCCVVETRFQSDYSHEVFDDDKMSLPAT